MHKNLSSLGNETCAYLVSDHLNYLHHYQNHNNSSKQDIGSPSLKAISYCKISKSAAAESPPPTMVTAGEAAIALAMASVPWANWGYS